MICCIIVLRLDIHVEVRRICGPALLVICCCRSILSIWTWSSLTALNLKWSCTVLVFLCPAFQGKSHSYLVVSPCSACLPILLKAHCHWQTWDPWSRTLCFPFRFQRFCQENSFVASFSGAIESSCLTQPPKPIVNPTSPPHHCFHTTLIQSRIEQRI